MKNRLMTLIFTGLVASAMLASPALAQTTQPDPGHPRVNEVDHRLENQQNRENNLTPGQASRDEHRDARVQRQMSRDEAKHGGHLTRREQRHMNHELNRNSHDIHRQHRHDRHNHQ